MKVSDYYIDAMLDMPYDGRTYEDEYSSYYNNYCHDPLYYHSKVYYDKIVHETEKAIYIKYSSNNTFWCPKALIKEHNRSSKKLYMLTEFLDEEWVKDE